MNDNDRPDAPLRIRILITVETDRPEVRLNSSKPENLERMFLWLDRRPELRELVDCAIDLRDRQTAT